MSLLPTLFDLDDIYNDPWHWHYYPRRRHQHFGLGISPAELHALLELPVHLQRQALDARTRKSPENQNQVMNVGKDGFQVCMDVNHFKPSEISVKTVDNEILIEGKHEEQQDEHGYISRQFIRRYTLPKGYDINTVSSTLSSDGLLTIKAPKPQQIEGSNERVIQIQQTGPAHLSVKENMADESTANKGASAEQK